MKQFGNPTFLIETPVSEQFFHDPLFVQVSKREPRPLILWGEGYRPGNRPLMALSFSIY